MTREELRVALGPFICGCGCPEQAAQGLLAILELCPLFENEGFEQLSKLCGDKRFAYLLVYILNNRKLLEHGGSAGGSWLTPHGEVMREALRREFADGFETLFAGEGWCIHGYIYGDCLECR